MYDLLIKDATIVDGTEKPRYLADIGIFNEKIVKIGKIEKSKARKIINAAGLIVSPGFIDIHSHADLSILYYPKALDKIKQGVTTQVIGNCGFSVAPVKDKDKEIWKENISEIVGTFKDFTWDWNKFGEYLNQLKKRKTATNIIPLVGYGAIRNYISGFRNYQYKLEDLAKVKKLIAQTFEEGARGISFGLIYPPTVYADKKEITEICDFVSRNKKLISCHIRNEGNYLVDSVKEIIKIAKISGGNIEISHFKVMGKMNWCKKLEESLELINEANEEGCCIDFDQYPYTAVSTYLKAVLPPWVNIGGNSRMLERIKSEKNRRIIKGEFKSPPKKDIGWDNFIYLINQEWEKIIIAGIDSEKNKYLQGKSIYEIASIRNESPEDVIFNLLREEKGRVAMIAFLMSEEDVIRIMKNRYQKVGSDSIYNSHPHPRTYGSFPRIIRKYVREKKVLSLEEAIYKMTYATAKKLNISNRGIIGENKFADIVIFDFENITDKSTYDDPIKYPDGIKYVIVNGSIVFGEELSESLPGKIL